MKNLPNNQLAFFVARVTIGINFLVHGLVRIPKLSKFAEGLASGFKDSYIPEALVIPFGHTLPFIELLLGLLLLVGFKTKFAAVAGGLLIAVLTLGAAMKEDWPLVGSLTVYAIFFFLLIKNLDQNAIAIDGKSRAKVDGFK